MGRRLYDNSHMNRARVTRGPERMVLKVKKFSGRILTFKTRFRMDNQEAKQTTLLMQKMTNKTMVIIN